jgi:hypothetical protein
MYRSDGGLRGLGRTEELEGTGRILFPIKTSGLSSKMSSTISNKDRTGNDDLMAEVILN